MNITPHHKPGESILIHCQSHMALRVEGIINYTSQSRQRVRQVAVSLHSQPVNKTDKAASFKVRPYIRTTPIYTYLPYNTYQFSIHTTPIYIPPYIHSALYTYHPYIHLSSLFVPPLYTYHPYIHTSPIIYIYISVLYSYHPYIHTTGNIHTFPIFII